MILNRRTVLGATAASLAFAGFARSQGAPESYRNEIEGYGPLKPDPQGIFDLPEGFSYRVVAFAGQTMDDIMGSVRRVSEIIGKITSDAAEQSDGIGQMSKSVKQLDQMTQQNAAMVEQSAAAAESLKDQAARLVGVVSTFKLH